MRAARAAKGEPGTNNFHGQLDGLLNEPKGSVIDFLLQAALPILKPLVDELCAKEPQQRGTQLALWMLERAGAPTEPLAELRKWSSLAPEGPAAVSERPAPPGGAPVVPPPAEPHPPAEPRKEVASSPKTKALQRSDPEGAQENKRKPVEKHRSNDSIDSDTIVADRKSTAGTEDLVAMLPQTLQQSSGTAPSKHDKVRRRVSIWQETAEQEEDDDKDIEDERDQKAMARMRGSLCQAPNSNHHPAGFDSRRRRFTVNLSQVMIDMPPDQATVDLLRGAQPFRHLDEKDLLKLARVAKCQKYEADENIMIHGCVTDAIHVVVEGVGRVCVPHQTGSVKSGDFFGAEALSLAASTSDQQISAHGGAMTTISISSADFHNLGLKGKLNKVDQSHKARKFNEQAPNTATMEGGQLSQSTCSETQRPIVHSYQQSRSDRMVIAEAVMNNKLLGEVLKLDEQQCELVADSVYLISLPAGEVLFSEGDRGKSLYIVQEGLLSVEKDLQLHLRAGDSFGELAILYDTPRTATISAAKDSLLWVLSSENFKLVTRMAYKQRIDEYASVLRRIPCISKEVLPEDISMIADVLEEFTVYEGEDVCVEGEDEDLLFIIYKGDCSVLKDDQVIGTLGSGEWVGQEQLTEGIPADRTVRATSEVVTVLALDKSSWKAVIYAMEQVGRISPSKDWLEDGSFMPNNKRNSMRGSLLQANPYIDHGDKSRQAHELVLKKMQRVCKKALAMRQIEHDVARTEMVCALGEGAFGCVVLLQDSISGMHYALKALSKDHITKEKMGSSVQNERSVMSLIESDFVVRLFTTYQDSENLFFMMEPVLGGELFDVYNDRDLFGDLSAAKFFIACVTLGLQHLHLKRVIYRDLKLENCLLAVDGYLKLTDMGIAKVVIGKTYTICGTADYFAPETLKQTGHNRAVDWWACGVLLFIMSTGKSPFDAPEVTQIYKNIMKGFSKVKFPDSCPSDLIDVIKGLCRKKPEERITMQKGGVANLQEMGFFSRLDWESLAHKQVPPYFVPEPPNYEKMKAKTLSRKVDINGGIQVWDGSLPDGF